jgi:hypothetical protein
MITYHYLHLLQKIPQDAHDVLHHLESGLCRYADLYFYLQYPT